MIEKVDLDVQGAIDELLIIENRSTDSTLDVACAAIQGLTIKGTVIQNDENYGFGGSMKRAFLYAIENSYTHLITLHGDDQADIHDLLDTLSRAEIETDLTIGARFHPDSVLAGYSAVRIAGNRVLNIAFGLVARQRTYDMIAGLNLFRVEFYRNREFLNFPDNLTFDAHLLLFSVSRSASIRYIPVTWREEDQVSNAKTVKQAVTILRLLARYVARRRRVFDRDKSERGASFQYPGRIVASHKTL